MTVVPAFAAASPHIPVAAREENSEATTRPSTRGAGDGAHSHSARRRRLLLLAAALPIFVALDSAVVPATAYQPPLISTARLLTATSTRTHRVVPPFHGRAGLPRDMSATLTRRSSPTTSGRKSPSSSSSSSSPSSTTYNNGKSRTTTSLRLQCCEDGSCLPLSSFVPTQFLGGTALGKSAAGGDGGQTRRQMSRGVSNRSRGSGGGRGRGLMGALFSSLSADEADDAAVSPSASFEVSDDESDVTATASSPSPVVTSNNKQVRLLRMPQINGDAPSDSSSTPSSSSSANFENSATVDVLVRWKENLYKLSNYASMLCVVDCTLLPIITVLLPLFGIVASPAQAAWLHELGHRVALWFVLPVGGLAATMNYLSLRNPILSSLAALGLSLIYAANGGHHSPLLSRLPHDLAHALHCGTVLHRTVNVVGCSLLLGSNYLSHRLGGCSNKDCEDERCRR